ncbi:patatin-like phospholipase family protein [Verticiella sediminum]|nr:patatin-like phospholipase family protein [Verticiella sediminum]
MTRAISLALQGGGSHGAFTWGVLDRLLEDERVHVEALSGTSSGAMNAAILTAGYARGGAAGARDALERFWRTISEYSSLSPVQRNWTDHLTGTWNLDSSPGYLWSNWFSSLFSPYQTNPFNLHPLRDILRQQLDIDALHACTDIRIFVAATNVRTGRARVFQREDVTIDALLASACLPHIYQAVEIDGEAYWDGGYMGNPAIWPLIYNTETADVVLVQINPLRRESVPRTPSEIANRLDEIAFNSSLMHEMRAIAFVQRLLEQDALREPVASRYKNVRMHMLSDEAGIAALGPSSKANAERNFVTHLKNLGRACAEQWLTRHYDDLGKRSSLNIRETFL